MLWFPRRRLSLRSYTSSIAWSIRCRHVTSQSRPGQQDPGTTTLRGNTLRILARHGVELEIRNSAGAVEDLDLLRDPASGVQAALTTFGVTQPADTDILYSLGGIFDAAIFIFYRNAEPVTLFAQFRGKRLSIGMPGTALRSLMLDVLKATDALDASTHLLDLDYTAGNRRIDCRRNRRGDRSTADGNPCSARSTRRASD